MRSALAGSGPFRQLHAAGGRALVVARDAPTLFESSLHEQDDCVTAVAGRMLSTGLPREKNEAAAISRLLPDPTALDAALATAAGQFSMVRIAADGEVTLASDRLGIRPMYVGLTGRVLAFGSSLTLLRAAFPELFEVADLAGQAQVAALGFTLGERTPHARVRRVEPACRVVVGGDAILRSYRYAQWSLCRPDIAWDGEASAQELAARFRDAVRRRADSGRLAAYLSGGLDSRCVVAALTPLARERDQRVHTINFAAAGSADLVLGALAARALGTQHFEYTDGRPGFWQRSVESVRHWMLAQRIGGDDVVKLVSGFGGESVLAPTNLNASMLAALRANQPQPALQEFIAKFSSGVPLRLLRDQWRRTFPGLLLDSFAAELARHPAPDPAQSMHLLLLHNEPRGNLAQHFEDLDARRVEWVFPFYDSDFVQAALQLPLDELLRHRFYYRWLEQFGTGVSGVPWQAYPGSLPCPLPRPPGLRDQWPHGWFDAAAQRAERLELAQRVRDQLRDPRFPDALIDRRALRLVCLATRLGATRYEYMLQAADVFFRSAARRYELAAGR